MKIKSFTQFSLLLMLLISLLTACNKEKGGVTPNVLLKLDKVTISDGTFRHYTYDALGRRSRVDYKGYSDTYNYNANTVIATTTYSDPTRAKIVDTYTLNSKGLVSKVSSTSSSADIEHDSNGRITKITNRNNTSSITSENFYTYDSDGDLVTTEYRSASSPTSNFITQLTVDKSHYNTTSNEFSGFEWYGKNSLHSIAKEVITFSNGKTTTLDRPRNYDAKGYILSQVNSFTLNASAGTATVLSTADYTYK